jgi:uncharacterized protein YllA (UPF0747 family)
MPYLDWKVQPGVTLRMVDHERLETEVQISLSRGLIQELHGQLQAVFVQAEAELRIDFPGNWTLYWKARDGESRMLLAHPEKDQWVGTVAWSQATVNELLREVDRLHAETTHLALSGIDRVSGFSNLEVRLERLS